MDFCSDALDLPCILALVVKSQIQKLLFSPLQKVLQNLTGEKDDTYGNSYKPTVVGMQDMDHERI
eukprot:13341570-Ditylum_brightwellii.AAC.1